MSTVYSSEVSLPKILGGGRGHIAVFLLGETAGRTSGEDVLPEDTDPSPT